MDKSLIGIKWKLGGRDRDGVDCLGLVILAEREMFGVEIPDRWPYTESTYGTVSRQAFAHMVDLGYEIVGTPRNGDIAFFEINGYGHLSVWVDGQVLSIIEGGTSNFKKRNLPFTYFRPRGDARWA